MSTVVCGMWLEQRVRQGVCVSSGNFLRLRGRLFRAFSIITSHMLPLQPHSTYDIPHTDITTASPASSPTAAGGRGACS